ncbi:MAG: hypothetical protein HYR60_11820 [Acidobacteria bacterium]|nr:hypothetical protein [Acidobacteriota bacterium]MBI3473033.1 hypothetical protein [Candidatus Solibacter usitatus]
MDSQQGERFDQEHQHRLCPAWSRRRERHWDSIKKALDWANEWTLRAAQHAAQTGKMSLSMTVLVSVHGMSTEASSRAVEVKKAGFGTS